MMAIALMTDHNYNYSDDEFTQNKNDTTYYSYCFYYYYYSQYAITAAVIMRNNMFSIGMLFFVRCCVSFLLWMLCFASFIFKFYFFVVVVCFVCLFVCLFKVEISSRTLISLLMPGSVHSGSASFDNCGRMFPDKLLVSSLPDRFPYYAWTAA